MNRLHPHRRALCAPTVRPRALAAGLAAGLVAVTAVAALPAAATAGSTPDTPGDDRRWDRETGWFPLPAMPAAAPSPSWTVETALSDTEAYWISDGSFVTIGPAAAGAEVTSIDPADGSAAWTTEVGLGERPRVATQAPGVLVVEDAEGAMALIDPATGAVLHDAPTGAEDLWTAAGLTIVREADAVTAIDPATGEQRWESARRIRGNGGHLVFTTAASDAAAEFGVIDPETGAERWAAPLPLFSDVHALETMVVHTVDEDGPTDTATGYDLETGELRWQVELDGLGRTQVAALTDELAVVVPGGGDPDPQLHVVDVTSGEVRWSLDGPEGDSAIGFVVGSAPYVATISGDGLTVRAGDTGDVVVDGDADRAAVVAGGVLVLADRTIRMIELPSGDERWSVELADGEDHYAGGAVDGGFVTERVDGDAVIVTGYTGS